MFENLVSLKKINFLKKALFSYVVLKLHYIIAILRYVCYYLVMKKFNHFNS